MATTKYTVTCRRAGTWWAISVPELKGVHTQARRLDQVAGMAREAIALFLDVRAATIDVDVRPHAPAAATTALKARTAALAAERRAERATMDAVTKLRADGYTVRDVGRLLGISPQRVSQIASRARRRDPAA